MNCGSGSGSFLFFTDLKKFYRKKHGCLRKFRKLFTTLIMLLRSKKVIFKVSFKTIRSRSCSRNSNLRLRGPKAERNIFGSTTLLKREVNSLCSHLKGFVTELAVVPPNPRVDETVPPDSNTATGIID